MSISVQYELVLSVPGSVYYSFPWFLWYNSHINVILITLAVVRILKTVKIFFLTKAPKKTLCKSFYSHLSKHSKSVNHLNSEPMNKNLLTTVLRLWHQVVIRFYQNLSDLEREPENVGLM